MTGGRHLLEDHGEQHQKQEEYLYKVRETDTTCMFEVGEEKADTPDAYRPLSHRCVSVGEA